MKLIDEWKQALKLNSVQLALLLAFLSAAQADILPLIQPLFPEKYWPAITGALALLIILLRLRLQPGLRDEDPKP